MFHDRIESYVTLFIFSEVEFSPRLSRGLNYRLNRMIKPSYYLESVSRSNGKRKRKKFGSLSGHCLISTQTGKMGGKKIIPWTLEQIRLHERATVQRSCQISRTGAFSPETRPDLIITNYVRVRADCAYIYIPN